MKPPAFPSCAVLWLLAPVPPGSRIDAFRHEARRTLARRAGSRLRWAIWFLTDRARFWALYREALCHLTAFFRDPDVTAALRHSVLPAIVKRLSDKASIRVWVPGCSTGAEAYSLAILLAEVLGECVAARPVEVLGMDRSEEVIGRARNGFYTLAELHGLSPARLERFFTPENGGYRVNGQLREMCSFSRHDLLEDVPPGDLDLVSCRNVIGHFVNRSRHSEVFRKLHECLRPSGFLVLGKNEPLCPPPGLFSTCDLRLRIFKRVELPSSTQQA